MKILRRYRLRMSRVLEVPLGQVLTLVLQS